MSDAALPDQKKQIREAAEAACAFFTGRDEINSKPRELIETLCNKTRELLTESEIAVEDARFTQGDLSEWLYGERGQANAKQIRTHWRSAAEIVREYAPGLSATMGQQRQRLVLRETETKGGRGNIKYYYLDLEPFEQLPVTPQPVPPNASGDGNAHYLLVSQPVAHWLAKPFTALDVTPARLVVLMTLTAFVALVLPVASLYLLTHSGLLAVLIALACTGGLYLALLHPLLVTVANRVAIAPGWMYRLNLPSAQLISVKSEAGQTLLGHPLRQLRLVVFEAACPVCGGRVVPMKGGGQYRGRIIGQCRENPLEHLYSFDHVTRIGVPLRADTYQGNHQQC